MSKRGVAGALLALVLLAGCGGRHSPAGFRLPENGDPDRGRQAFVDLECHVCHSVNGVVLPKPTGAGAVVPLGGAVTELRTDGYLVTALIHPSHRLAAMPTRDITVEGASRMPDYTDRMTVRQMTDIVAFLQSRYELKPAPPPYY